MQIAKIRTSIPDADRKNPAALAAAIFEAKDAATLIVSVLPLAGVAVLLQGGRSMSRPA